MRFDMKFEYKPFPVELGKLHSWLKSNAGQSYVGMSAASAIEIHFSSEPTQNIKDTVQAYWDSLTQSEEAAKIAYYQKSLRAKKAAIGNLPFMSWNEMSYVERKLLMNQTLADEDWAYLVSRYPQV